MEESEQGQWYSILEAADMLHKSERTVRRLIDNGELKTAMVDGVKKVWLNIETGETEADRLREDNAELKEQVKELIRQLGEKDNIMAQAQERHDTIIMSMNKQSQLLLEDKRGFWSRWRREKKNS